MTQLRAEETRERILQAAQTCFAQAGYEATGTAEICRQAGLSKGAFYHHFPAKQAVFLELLNRWLAGLDARMTAARAGAASTPDELRAMAASAAPVFQGGGEGQMALFLEFWSQAARDPQVREAALAPYHRYRDDFADRVRAGQAEGSLGPADPPLVAHVIVSLAVGLLLQSLLDPRGADWGAVARAGLDIVLNGLPPDAGR